MLIFKFKRRFFLPLLLVLAAQGGLGWAETESSWKHRADLEEKWRSEGLTLIPYRLNYFLPVAYNTSPHPSSRNREQHFEAKFQISFKVLLLRQLWRPNTHLYFGYTQMSFWQVYDQNRSAPFRDTNYEPELIVALDTERHFGEFVMRRVDFGAVHQSNGTGPPDSRTWNRLYGKFYFDRDRLSFTFKPWIRIHDSPTRKDNRDIDRFMGYGEATVSYVRKNHILSVLVRNNLESKNRGAVQLDYTFPLTDNLTGLLQYFSGYGESLLDYNQSNNRFSVGIALSDWH
jgi:phospholipase A1